MQTGSAPTCFTTLRENAAAKSIAGAIRISTVGFFPRQQLDSLVVAQLYRRGGKALKFACPEGWRDAGASQQIGQFATVPSSAVPHAYEPKTITRLGELAAAARRAAAARMVFMSSMRASGR